MPNARPSKWLTLIAACLGLGMLMIDTFVVNVALPAMERDLDASLSHIQWTVSAYTLVLGVLPLTMGRLGDIYGRRRVYILGLVVFVAGSALAGAAQDIVQLILFRVVQASGAAAMMPGTLAIVTSAFPPQQRGLAIGIWGGVSGLGLIAGPILGGLLVNGDEWRWIFLVNVPVGVAGLIMAWRYIPESRDEGASRRIDWPGLVLVTGGLLALMVSIIRGEEDGWTAAHIIGGFILSVFLLGAFVAVERRARAPLVDPALFRNGTFVAACLAAFAFQAGTFGSLPYTSLFMQNYWGFSPLEAGFAIVPSTIVVAALMPVSGIVAQRLGSRLRLVIMSGSLCVLLAGAYLFTLDTESTYSSSFLPAFLVRGLGIGLFMSASSFAVVSSLPVARAGLASGTLTAVRNIGTAVGVAVLSTVYIAYAGSEVPERLPALEGPALEQTVQRTERFSPPADDPETERVVGEIIVDGYVWLIAVSVGMGLFATGAAAFIHRRTVDEEPLVAVPGTPPPLAQPVQVSGPGQGTR